MGEALAAALRAPDPAVAGAVRAAAADLAAAVYRIALDAGPGSATALDDLRGALERALAPAAGEVAAGPAATVLPAALPDTVPPAAPQERRPPPSPEAVLARLADETARAHPLWLGDGDAPTGDPWAWLHLQGRRLPWDDWQRLRAQAAAVVGEPTDADADGADPDLLVPPCPKLGHRGLVAGRMARDAAAAAARLGAAGLEQALDEVLGIVDALATIAARCADVRSAREPDNVVPLTAQELVDYVCTVGDVAGYRGARHGIMHALIAADEGAACLLPWPPPASDSWWRQCLARSVHVVQVTAAATGVALLVDDPTRPAWKKIEFRQVRAFGPAGQGENRRWPLRVGMRDGSGPGYEPRMLIIQGAQAD